MIYSNGCSTGDRVVAIRDTDGKYVNIFGYGVLQEERLMGTDLYPVILLDSGKEVWGYECWWMSEKDFKNTTPTHLTIKEVSLGEK